MPLSRFRRDPEAGRNRGGDSTAEPYWRRDHSWKRFLDPRHPVTRATLGGLLSCFPIVGPVVVLAGGYYFGCARGRTMLVGIGLSVFLAGLAALQWYMLEIKISSDLRLTFADYADTEGGFPKIFFVSGVCVMGLVSFGWLFVAYKLRGPQFCSDGDHSIELQDRRRLRQVPSHHLPPDDGAYAARQLRAEPPSEIESSAAGSEDERPILPRSQPVSARSSRHRSISVQIPERVHQPEGTFSAGSSASSSSFSPVAPIPSTHLHRRGA
ncbi:hypothetical protein JCM3765_003561 [Sporobolomyces pararoseus]